MELCSDVRPGSSLDEEVLIRVTNVSFDTVCGVEDVDNSIWDGSSSAGGVQTCMSTRRSRWCAAR